MSDLGGCALLGSIDVLGSKAPIGKKRDAARELVDAGWDAIPVLIEALDDGRAYERRDGVNRMNLPGHLPPPKPLFVTVTVGHLCEDLLYEIITPKHGSTYGGNFKVFSEQILRVPDWRTWWAANRTRTLEDIHKELQPLVDAYWMEHGTTQTIDT